MQPLDLGTYITVAAGVAGAVGLLWKRVRVQARRADAVDYLVANVGEIRELGKDVADLREIVARELTHNGGGSIKDDVHGMAINLGKADRRLDRLEAIVLLAIPNERKPL